MKNKYRNLFLLFGVLAIVVMLCTMDMDYSGAGVDLQVNVTYIQGIVSEEGLGTYTFTIGTDNINGCQSLIDIVNTTVWAK